MIFFVFLAVFTFGFYLYKLITRSARLKELGDRLPGPKALPILGNGLDFLLAKTFLGKFEEFAAKYGPVYRLWLGKELVVMLSDPEDLEMFLSKSAHLDKPDQYHFLDPWLGTKGLLIGDTEAWRAHRKLLAPSFHLKMLENSIEMTERNARILCTVLENKIDQPEFDIENYIERCTLDIISEAAMGTKLETQLSRNVHYLNDLNKIKEIMVVRTLSPWLHPDFIFDTSSYGRMFHKAVAGVKKFASEIIIQRRVALTKELEKVKRDETHDLTKRKTHKIFLDFMICESNFTNEELEDEVQTFMFAGHDTTTVAISFCLYALSNNPEVQERLVEELRSVFVNGDESPSYHDYMNMKYLDNVIKEALRIYTPVSIIGRKILEDVCLPSGHVLPANCSTLFFLRVLHLNPKIYPNPLQFDPDRFNNDDRHNYAYLPFSAGPRNCIGQKFALLEIKIILSILLLKYRFLPAINVKSLDIENGIVIRSLQHVPIRITKRTN